MYSAQIHSSGVNMLHCVRFGCWRIGWGMVGWGGEETFFAGLCVCVWYVVVCYEFEVCREFCCKIGGEF
jgi:hypothetical protein